MGTSLYQEVYKLKYQRTPIYGIVILFLLMLYTAANDTTRNMISMGYGTGQWIIIILIAIGSYSIAMEFQNRTIVNLFYKNSHKEVIYFSKYIVLVAYGILLTILGTIFSIILAKIFVGNKYDWSQTYHNGRSLINNLLVNELGTILLVFLVVALAFFLIALFKINAVVVGIGLGIAYLGSQISTAFMQTFVNLAWVIRWNPFNMFYIMGQLSDNTYPKYSNLNNEQIIFGTIIYTIIFLGLGYILFRRRRV